MNKPQDSPPTQQQVPPLETSLLLKKAKILQTKASHSYLVLIFCLLLIPISRFFSSSNPHAHSAIKNNLSDQDKTFQVSNYPVLFSPNDPHEMIKPIYDKREYHYVTLKNGIKVLMISDPSAEQSSAALVLEVGSSLEPVEIPGLAHLLEHILSLGSKNYDKGFYERKVYASAAISREEAVFYYDKLSKDFEESLEIFVDSFINPRFDFDWYNSELFRIDDEFKEKIEVKVKRFFLALRHLVDPESRFSRDYTGNLETLLYNPIKEGLNVSQALQNFFKKYYSSNLMSLVVLHNKPLDEMEAIIKETFSKIPNKNLVKPSLDTFALPLTDNNRYQILKYHTPVFHESEGMVLFQICGIKSKFDAIEFILDVMKRDTEGSLSKELKNLNLISKMRTYFFVTNSDCGILRLIFDLTTEGNDKFEELVQTIFGYLRRFMEDGLTEEHYNQHFYRRQYLFKYIQSPWDEESDDKLKDQLKVIGKNMLKYSSQCVLSKFEPYYNVEERLNQARSILEEMNTENLLLLKSVIPTTGSQYFNKSLPFKQPEILKNYDAMSNIYFTKENISKKFIKRWNRTTSKNFTQFQFMRGNPYYPKNFNLVQSGNADVVQIRNDTWYSNEKDEKLPIVAFYLKSNKVRSLEEAISFELMLDLLSPGIVNLNSSEIEDIRYAGHTLDISAKHIKVEAFSENLERIVDWLNKHYIHKEIVGEVKKEPSDVLLEFDHKFSAKYPLSSEEEAVSLLDEILVNRHCTSGVEIKEQVLNKIMQFLENPVEEFEKRREEIFSDLDYLFYGNILPEDALKIVEKIGDKNTEPNSDIFRIGRKNLIYKASLLNLRKNENLVMNYYQGFEPATAQNIANLKILLNIMNRMISGLNIEKELNIKVKITEHIKGNTTGFVVSMQDKNFRHNGIDRFIENFLEDFNRIMHRASEEMIESEVKEASRQLVRSLESHYPNSFSQKAQEMFRHIDNEDYNFMLKKEVIGSLRATTGKGYLASVDEFFASCGKLSLQGFSKYAEFPDQIPLEADTQFTTKSRPQIIKTLKDIENI